MPFVSLVAAWFLVFAVLFVLSDSAHKYLYDSPLAGLWWRSLLAALPIVALLYFVPVRFDEMFTQRLGWTVLHCLLWFAIFWFALGYLPIHAGFLGPVTFLLTGWAVVLLIANLSAPPKPLGMIR